MQTWIQFVSPAKLDPKKLYFIGRIIESQHYIHVDFYSRGLNGKTLWSGKPGIALRFNGDAVFKAEIEKQPFAKFGMKLVAIDVPADADKRWRARKHKRPRKW